MLCLPDLWNDITVDEIIELIGNFSNSFSYYSLIYFTYRYVEIDIISEIFNLSSLTYDIRIAIATYVKSQYPNFLKDESDYLFFEKDVYGMQNEDWMYIKQKLLVDGRVEPALKSLNELKYYIDKLQLTLGL